MFEMAWSKLKGNKLYNKLMIEETIDASHLISHSAFLQWEEHCVECSAPDCYSTCPLYIARTDFKCSRFADGINKISEVPGGDGFSVYIEFRRWAKLETQWPKSPRLYTLFFLRKLTLLLNSIEKIISFLSEKLVLFSRKRKLNEILYWLFLKSYPFLSEAKKANKFDGLLFQFYSLDKEMGGFQFELYNKNGVQYRTRFPAMPGLNQYFLDQESLPSGNDFRARLWNEGQTSLKVIISWLHLVRFNNVGYDRLFNKVNNNFQQQLVAEDNINLLHSEPVNHIKCLVFDLDNTLWDGVIGDVGEEGVKLNSNMVSLIMELDSRGIICSVCSKNNFEIAWEKIKQISLDEYLLFPKINWLPKSENIKSIAREMNIGMNAIALIDDSLFERTEVSQNSPEVRCYDALEGLNLLTLPEFNPPLSNLSAKRRLSYLTESKRINTKINFKGNIDDFLKSCEMNLTVLDPTQNKDRCYELVMRSNQFNISGLKYNKEDFFNILSLNQSICWSVNDRFGEYGVVGFLRWEQSDSHLVIIDFVMSCRVAEKRVEEAIFSWFLENICLSKTTQIRFVNTNRNKPIFDKLTQIGAELVSSVNDISILTITKEMLSKNPSVLNIFNKSSF
jgi:FkbH-like protein